MKNVGILTCYYNSNNYGGILQAYALTKYINSRFGDFHFKKDENTQFEDNLCAEQIQYKPFRNETSKKEIIKKVVHNHSFFGLIKLVIEESYTRFVKHFLFRRIFFKADFNGVNKRDKAVLSFGLKIPHSEHVFLNREFDEAAVDRNANVARMLNKYDIFIVGSDQVWRETRAKGYFLYYVSDEKKKISYAASISRNHLNEHDKAFFRQHLKNFNAISVREQNAVGLLQKLCDQPIEWVLDPTLILDVSDWEEICSKRIIEERYLFCYFLGPDKRERKLAKKYAKEHHLKLVTLPFLTEQNYGCDFFFGKDGLRLFEVSPADFLSLIKYADYVFTDSFHAAVFSGIFEREYVVFERAIKGSMGSRIETLLSLYETSERYCNTPERRTLSYIDNLMKIDYTRNLEKLSDMKRKSKNFLRNALLN